MTRLLNRLPWFASAFFGRLGVAKESASIDRRRIDKAIFVTFHKLELLSWIVVYYLANVADLRLLNYHLAIATNFP